eukprot:3939952-Rhodomonas_salina.1
MQFNKAPVSPHAQMLQSASFQTPSSSSFCLDEFLVHSFSPSMVRDDSTDLLGLMSPSASDDDAVPRYMSREVSGLVEDEDTLRLVNSWFASRSTSPKQTSSSVLAGVDGDVDALAETRQLDGCSHNARPIEEPIERDMAMAVTDIEYSAPYIESSAPFPALSAPEPAADTKARHERKNAYNSREHKINRELLALLREGKVELWFGEHGIGGEQTISAIRSWTWGEVIDRLNRSINSESKAGTPSENLAQCLRDCGVVPKTEQGKVKKNWKKPVEGMWEMSGEAWAKRRKRLEEQYAQA